MKNSNVIQHQLDLEQDTVLARSYDYIIVGAGSAGCVVARRLIDGTDAKVLLLEAGESGDGNVASLSNPTQWVQNFGSQYDWAYRYAPSSYVEGRSIHFGLGKVLGGSGRTNGMTWARGHRADYDDWAAAGNAGWDFESVLPLFKKSEDWEDGESEFRGAGGPIRVERAKNLHPTVAAFIEAGCSYGMPYLNDMNVPEPEGVGPMNLNVKGGVRSSPAAFLGPVMGHPNLTILTGAQVVRLTLSGSRCVGLEFHRDGQLHSVHAAKEVVVCAGAIHTPRLLMLSGIGPQEDLKQRCIDTVIHLPGVGRNLQDHPLLTGLIFEAKHPLPAPNNNLAGSAFFWRSRPALDRPDLMVFPIQVPLASDELRAEYPIPPNAFCIAVGLMRPESRGYVRLKSRQPDGPLEIQPNFLKETADINVLVNAVELGLDIASENAYRDVISNWVAPAKRLIRGEAVAFVRRACSTYNHPVGTCAMGRGREAVVDAKLRVHGVQGLRIADASIMPTIPSANTNAPSIMIGEFVSRLLVYGQNHRQAIQETLQGHTL